MASQVGSIIRKSIRQENDRINVLSFVTHERYGYNMGKCNANFYLIQKGNGVKGDWRRDYAPVPDNTIVLPPVDNPLDVLPWVNYDLVLSQHKFGQFQMGKQLADYLHVPQVNIEHTTITNNNLRQAVPELKKLNADINLFISATSREQWGYFEDEADVIEHGVDSQFFKPSERPRKQQILTVGNDMLNRSEILGFDIFQRITQGLPIFIVGDTQGLSRPAQNIYQLKQFYTESLIYCNPSRYSPIPMSLLEAASCGCAIVTTDNNLITNIFTDGYDCVKSNDESILRSALQRLLNDPAECKRLGDNARQTIVKRFDLKRFVSDWDNVFRRCLRL